MHYEGIAPYGGNSLIKFLSWLVGEPLGCVEMLENLTQLKAKTQVAREGGVYGELSVVIGNLVQVFCCFKMEAQ